MLIKGFQKNANSKRVENLKKVSNYMHKSGFNKVSSN